MVTGKPGRHFTVEVENAIQRFSKYLDVRAEAMEDALCKWEKRTKAKSAGTELGYAVN